MGINHQKTPIELREKVSFHSSHLQPALKSLLDSSSVVEATIVSTCNRVEIYTNACLKSGSKSVESFLHIFHELPQNSLDPHLYRFVGNDALMQLFKVATSLDSQIIGEPQILGQVKDAFSKANEVGACSTMLKVAFLQAFSTAKRVRKETDIAKNAVSTGFVAIELEKKLFGKIENLNCLILGAGKMSQLCARHFYKQHAKLTIANRTIENAKNLALELGAQIISLQESFAQLSKFDMVIASTASNNYLIEKDIVNRAIRQRRYRSMVLVDISLPRNIDPGVKVSIEFMLMT